jgi:protein phosphatase
MGMTHPVMSAMRSRGANDHFRYGCACVNGYREANEDAHLCELRDGAAFFGVFDGHSGAHCAEFLESEWRDAWAALPDPVTDEALIAAALAMDERYVKLQRLDGSCATFVVAATVGETVNLHVGNVGDSRVLVCKDGECQTLTVDHKPSDAAERRRIEAHGGRVTDDRVDGLLAISRAFGDAKYKRSGGGQLEQKVVALPDITHVTVRASAGDFAVLACDGVFEGDFADAEVVAFVQKELPLHADLAAVAQQVCDEAIRRGSKDNVSCVVVRFGGGAAETRHGGPACDFVPGAYADRESPEFRRAYIEMASKAGVTAARCFELRYDALAALPTAHVGSAASKEMSAFGAGPPADATGGARTEWFAKHMDPHVRTYVATMDPRTAKKKRTKKNEAMNDSAAPGGESAEDAETARFLATAF